MMEPFTGKSSEWNAIIRELPNPHLLQSWEWAQVKAAYGWKPMPFIWRRNNGGGDSIVAAAMLLIRRVLNRGFAARLCIIYIPKGPLLNWTDESLRTQVLDDLQVFAKKQGAIFLKLDPDIILGTGIPKDQNEPEPTDRQDVLSEFKRRKWLLSDDQIQFRNTVMIGLSESEEEMLARMKQKTRYNIRLAEKKGVTLRAGKVDDLPLIFKMFAETSVRDGFVIREESYYRTVWETFMMQPTTGHQPYAELLIAEVNGDPVAAIFVFYFAQRAYYIYGMSLEAHREKMPNYLLQWEAIKLAKTHGCTVYDLWGAPDTFNETDPMWGVYRFKEGLGGIVYRTIGAWDYPASSLWYGTYTKIVPRVLDVMRARGKARAQHEFG
jgi:lipid II:glycine glycyltransferase (peptidoglycan interpeptide bridge formation enzyme)